MTLCNPTNVPESTRAIMIIHPLTDVAYNVKPTMWHRRAPMALYQKGTLPVVMPAITAPRNSPMLNDDMA